ncbi:hypothetical protein [Flammeovirga agarivorans]|uniref:Uncharacterized protein n=1 Tax=Flammeovirga agarivorans TaxID=2726742 RepID=A0A7X8SH63_9BACT|nr:hypothetical protein [Flammeovirga agarivorans]NLR90104.1 hypothetical protein [Flammeovirga agarivorans]
MRQILPILLLIIGSSINTFSQQKDINNINLLEDTKPSPLDWDMSLTLKSQNVFRGLLPSAAPAMASQLGVKYKNWVAAMYGGVGLDGVYQETDFIFGYYTPRFNVRFEYYYNFTQGITDIPIPSGIFDFNRQTTRGFLDFIISVQLDKKGRWNLTSSTLVFGRDTYIETIEQEGEEITRRGDQRYTQYLQLEYNWYWGKNKLKAHIGGSFSLTDPSGSQFYGSKAGLNDVGLAVIRKVQLNDNITLPLKIGMITNPLHQTSYLNVAIDIFQITKW